MKFVRKSHVLIVFTLLIKLTPSQLIVELDTGKIQGRTDITSNNKTFYAFQEIPFAEPPIGDLRFELPFPIRKWEGILNTTENTKICYQITIDDYRENEDCLYLNVYTPFPPGSEANNSVLFFIYGGGFVDGHAAYDKFGPHIFMDNNLIVVTTNYRVGPLGFLSTGDTVIPGNNGLWDQNLALKWVNRNIHLFGGNSSQITIMGQSAGAASVAHHLISERSKGLFRAAIQLSGSALSPWSYQRHALNYTLLTTSYISKFFAELNNPVLLKWFLKIVSATQLKEVSAKIPEGIGNEQMIEGYFFAPVIEPNHTKAFITERMYKSFENGEFAKIPILMGMTSEEGNYRLMDYNFTAKVAEYDENVSNFVIEDLHIMDKEIKQECGEAIRRIYTNGSIGENLYNAVKYFSDVSFTKPIVRQAQLQSLYTDVYFYQFSYRFKMMDGSRITTGVFHSEDLYYLWKDANVNPILMSMDSDNKQAAERYAKLISNFVKFSTPTPYEDPELQNVILSPITENTFPYLNIDDNLTIATNPKYDAVEKWINIYEYYGVEPFDTY